MYVWGTRYTFWQGRCLQSRRQPSSYLRLMARARHQRSLLVTSDARGRSWLQALPRASLFAATTKHLQQICDFFSTIRTPKTLRIRRQPPTQQWLTLLPNHSPVSYRPSKAKLDSTSRPASASLPTSLKAILLQVIAPDGSCKRDKMKV